MQADMVVGEVSPPTADSLDAGWTARPIDANNDGDALPVTDAAADTDASQPNTSADLPLVSDAPADPGVAEIGAADLDSDSDDSSAEADVASDLGGEGLPANVEASGEMDTAGASGDVTADLAEVVVDVVAADLDAVADVPTPFDFASEFAPESTDAGDGALADSEDDSGADEELGGGASDTQPEVFDPNKCPYGLSAKTLCLKWGVCSSGVVLACVGNSPVCDYSGVPGYEEVEKSCDGLDNDCNMLVDDELPLPKQSTAKGVCDGQKPQCVGEKGWSLPDYATLPGYQTQETACDGLDNDCDGKTDQFVKAPPLSAKPGVCGLALQLCAGKFGWVDPPLGLVLGYQALESACDGKDNDCDGQTDENLGKANAPGSGIGKPNLGVCAGAPLQCKGGQWVAPDYPAWSALAAAGTSTFEEVEATCDGLDNDCNGIVDDVAANAPAASKVQGVCAGQVKVCAAAKGWQDPDFVKIAGYTTGPEVVCDGQDNDCDGKTDEEAACPRWQSGGKGNGRIALSPDGAQLAWLSATGVHVHNTLTGAHAYDHFGHRFGVDAVAFSPDGTRIASVGKIDALRVYYAAYGLGKPASWPLALAMGKAADHNTAVTWSPDAKTIAVGTEKGAVVAYDAASGAAIATWTPHNKAVRAVILYAKAAGGVGVVSGADDGKVQHMSDVAAPPQTLASFGSSVRHLHHDGASHRLVASADQLAPRVFALATGLQLATLAGLPEVAGVRLSPTGTTALATTANGQVWQWALPDGPAPAPPAVQPKIVADAPTGIAADVAVDLALAATVAYVGFQARGPAQFALQSKTWSWPVVRHVGPVFDLAAQGDVLWSAGHLGAVGVWASATGKAGGLHALHAGDVLTLAVAQPFGQAALLVTAATDYTVRVWQLADNPLPATPINLKTFGLGGPWAHDLVLTPGAGSIWAAAGSGAHRLGLTPATLGQKLQVYAVGLGASVRRTATSPDGQWLAVALDGAGPVNGDHLRLVHAANLQDLWSRKDLAANESAIAFRPQGDLLAVGGGSTGLVLLDSKTGETVAVLNGHTGAVRALDWTADGTRLLSTSNDGSARVWWVMSGKAPVSLVSMTRHCPGLCTGVSVTAGVWGDAAGSYAITASDDGAILGWDAPTAP